jgi:CRP/FNR family transcriptional regulator
VRLEAYAETVHAARGEILFHEGERAEWVYFLTEGRVQLRHLRFDGGVRTVCQIGSGESFCCLPSLDGGPYPATASAVVPSVLFRLPVALFLEFLGRHPSFTTAALHQFCARLREAGCDSGTSADSAAARLASKLLRVAAHESGALPLTRRELGEMAGTTVETAIRVTKEFERAGWLKLGRGRIEILDAASLAACARGDMITATPRAALRLIRGEDRRESIG